MLIVIAHDLKNISSSIFVLLRELDSLCLPFNLSNTLQYKFEQNQMLPTCTYKYLRPILYLWDANAYSMYGNVFKLLFE